MPLHAAVITLLTVLLLAFAMGLVSRARGKYHVAAPAVSGDPAFERTFRAHQNTLEQAVMFLPTLWIASLYGNASWAAWAGYAWLLARAWYVFAYAAGGKRGAPFTLSVVAWAFLWISALLGLWPALSAGPLAG
jgi:glutathione S-transferase